MNAFVRRIVFGLVAMTLVLGVANVASAKPWPPIPQPPYPHYHPHYYGPAVVVSPVGGYYAVDATNPAPAAAILLVNPAANQVALKYSLNGGPLRLLPAGTSVAIDRQSIVEFDRGGAVGLARYSLIGGVYRFVPAGGCWTLVQDGAEAAAGEGVVNAANPAPAN